MLSFCFFFVKKRSSVRSSNTSILLFFLLSLIMLGFVKYKSQHNITLKSFCVAAFWTELTVLDVLHFILFTKRTVEIRLVKQIRKYCELTLKIIIKKENSKNPGEGYSKYFIILNEQKITLYALGTQVSTWNPQSSWSITMMHKHFHCYFLSLLSCHSPLVEFLEKLVGTEKWYVKSESLGQSSMH